MSVQAITAALKIQDVSASEKLLLIVLANYADEKMQCWPSHSRLGLETCLSDRQVLRVFASLAAKGLIKRRARYVKKLRTTDMITLVLHGDTMSVRPDTMSPPLRGDTVSERGDTVSSEVGTPCPQGGDTMSPRTFTEPLEEPSVRERTRGEPSPSPADGQATARREQVGEMMKSLAASLKPPPPPRKQPAKVWAA